MHVAYLTRLVLFIHEVGLYNKHPRDTEHSYDDQEDLEPFLKSQYTNFLEIIVIWKQKKFKVHQIL